MQDHRQLRVWRKSHIHVLRVRKATDVFPKGYSNLKNQLTRSTESIAYNIVEGSAASSRAEFARFLEISIKSSRESEYQLLLARDYGILNDDRWRKLDRKNRDVRKMLCGLRGRLLAMEQL